MGRRSIIPFLVGSQRIASLQDLRKVIAENPEKLIIPLQDGRLERFLRGISNRYLECIDKENPKESIEKLAEKLGVEIQKDFTHEDVSVVTSVDELERMIDEGEKEIELSRGKFVLDVLILANPVKLAGQGKNDTHLKVKELIVASEGVIFENLICEAETLLLVHKPEVKDAFFKFKNCASQDMTLIRGIGENLEPKKVQIEITEPIVLEGKNVYYENVDFVIKEGGSIAFSECEGAIVNCSFSSQELKSKSNSEGEDDVSFILGFFTNSKMIIENCEFKVDDNLVGIAITDKAGLQISNCRFTGSGKKNQGIMAGGSIKLKVAGCKFMDLFLGIGGVGSQLEVLNCEFLRNEEGVSLFQGSEGMIKDSVFDSVAMGIGVEEDSRIEVVECKFTNCVSEGNNGAGIIITEGNGTVKSCEFSKSCVGIYEISGKLKVENCKFIDNTCFNEESIIGIGIAGFEDSQLEVLKCEFLNNLIGISLHQKSLATVKDSVFSKNVSSGISATDNSKLEVKSSRFIESVLGGIDGKGTSQLEVTNCEFNENKRGIWVNDNAKLKVTNSKFMKHKDPDGEGSGIIGFSTSQLEVTNCEFNENERGIWVNDNAKLKVTNSKFMKHKRPNGKGQGIFGVNTSRLEVTKCEFIENERDINAGDNAKLKVSRCNLNNLFCFSPYVEVTNSKVGTVNYYGESRKPDVKGSKVESWKDISGCYITTAVCLSLGKGDNCYELNTFRWFRDKWLVHQPDGKKLIEEYYETAPLIVNLINKRKDYKDIYFCLWEKYLNPCLELLEKKDFMEVKRIYIEMVENLKKQFLGTDRLNKE